MFRTLCNAMRPRAAYQRPCDSCRQTCRNGGSQNALRLRSPWSRLGPPRQVCAVPDTHRITRQCFGSMPRRSFSDIDGVAALGTIEHFAWLGFKHSAKLAHDCLITAWRPGHRATLSITKGLGNRVAHHSPLRKLFRAARGAAVGRHFSPECSPLAGLRAERNK